MRYLALILVIFSVGRPLSCQTKDNGQQRVNAPCTVNRTGVKFTCPSGWTILRTDERDVVIANFQVKSESESLGGLGRATITLSTLPRSYKNLAEWVHSGHKIAPTAVESRMKVRHRTFGEIEVVCLSSPEKAGPVYASYFFEIAHKPLLVELGYRAQDPKASQFLSIAREMIETVSLER